ncbi:hypothetical protein [Flavobacterium sp.]|uniref:hypothetical protein n=1 Tax=Flavobacterium sp. TaxID=239 RepID=UPI00261CBFA3|nr:hypothetical protein [Flavobacterium sp.]MDD2987131.1 hypothetical protein [Flavobacterium sp.]
MESQVIGHYQEQYIIQTLKYTQNYFKHTAVKQKAGFFLKALQEGYFKEEIQKEDTIKQRKVQRIANQENEDQEKQKMVLERNQQLETLREQYLSDEFIQAVLEEHKGGFLYPIMEKSRKESKTLNKYLQGFVDKKLLEEFG